MQDTRKRDLYFLTISFFKLLAGDHIKFGFPMAASTTLLAWGLLEYKDAYENSGQLEHMYDSIRWSLEWMLKCHTGPNELYVQVHNKATKFKS